MRSISWFTLGLWTAWSRFALGSVPVLISNEAGFPLSWSSSIFPRPFRKTAIFHSPQPEQPKPLLSAEQSRHLSRMRFLAIQ